MPSWSMSTEKFVKVVIADSGLWAVLS
jgi:hypothetical protein